jgi:probable phosphoglycerate mutase
MTILLIRHGETELNAARVMQPAATPLGARGLAQAQALGRRLAGAGLAGLVASDLPRAWQTAQAVSATTGLAALPCALLHERNFGDWRGRPHDSFAFDPVADPAAPPNGESFDTFCARVAQAWAWVLQQRQAAGGPLAVVSHGLVIAQMLRVHARLAAGVAAPQRLGNTSISVVAAAPPHHALQVDDTAHLADAAGDDAQALFGG